MNSTRVRMVQLANQGYQCSQILIILGLELKAEYNSTLVRAMGGLAWGCAEGSCTCGCLTGGSCLLAFLTGHGQSSEIPKQEELMKIKELVRWFWKKYGFPYGGVDCMAIREAEGIESAQERCWTIMESVYHKVLQLTGKSISDSENHYLAA